MADLKALQQQSEPWTNWNGVVREVKVKTRTYPSSFRLSEHTRSALEALSSAMGVSRAQVVELAIRRLVADEYGKTLYIVAPDASAAREVNP